MATKIVIENAVLLGSRQEQFLQRVATVYVDQTEYRVSAPAKATGNAFEWVKHFVVRQPSDSGMREKPQRRFDHRQADDDFDKRPVAAGP